MSDFYPVSPVVGITNTSYGAQAGVMDGKWAARVIRGKKILAEKTINELDLDSLVGVIFGHARIEGLSRHAVAMCAGRLMQFARQYQQAGVCPNYDVGNLTRDGEDLKVEPAAAEENVSASVESMPSPQSTTELEPAITPLGAVPIVKQASWQALWQGSVEDRAVLLAQIAAYGSSLPPGGLERMFNQTAEALVHMWAASGSAEEIVQRFAATILSCSSESQLPKTGTDRMTIETGRCQLLRVARETDPSGAIIPACYPCAYHEMIAKKVSSLVGLKIAINTSSTGCIVTVTV